MSDNKVRRAFRTTKIKINADTIQSTEQREQLESLFMTMDAAKTDAVAAERSASISTAKAKNKQASAKIAELEFLQVASSSFNQVAGERLWIIYRDADGVITLEGFTERLIRNNLRAQQDMLGRQIEGDGSSDVDRGDLYETGDDEQEPDGE